MNKPIQHAWCSHKDNLDRYNGLAELYDEFRPGYPPSLINELIRLSNLKAGNRVLDIGCGTGQLAFPLAEKGFKVTAIDLEQDMITLCQNKDKNHLINWICGKAEDVLSDQDFYSLVTMGRSFHWMDRSSILELVWHILTPDGVCSVIWDEFKPDTNKNEWSIRMKELAAHYAGYKAESEEKTSFLKHEEIIAQSKFGSYQKTQLDHSRSYTVEQVLGHYLSFSWCNKRVLGNAYNEFCEKARVMLEQYCEGDHLEEDMVFTILSMNKN